MQASNCLQHVSLGATTNGNGQSEWSEQALTEGTHALEDFIPRRDLQGSFEDDEDDEEEQHSPKQIKRDKESTVDKKPRSMAGV